MRRLLASIVGLAFVTSMGAQGSTDAPIRFLRTDAGQALGQVYATLLRDYRHELTSELLLRGALNGMTEALGDPYTTYEEPVRARVVDEDMSGRVEGVAVLLRPVDRFEGTTAEIIEVFADSLAAEAGLRRGDIVVRIEGDDVHEAPVEVVADLLRGPAGTVVTFHVLRAGRTGPVEVSVVREPIQLSAIESRMLKDGIAYIRVKTFANRETSEQLQDHLQRLGGPTLTGLVLDMRDNGGGLLRQGLEVADAFLEEGVLVYRRTAAGVEVVARASPGSSSVPTVVLVNRFSASAAEVVAGALQDHGRALLMGESTFGKGVGQSALPLQDGGRLIYTSFEWLTPDQNTVDGSGLTPDVHVDDVTRSGALSVRVRGVSPGAHVEARIDGNAIGGAWSDPDGIAHIIEPGTRPDARTLDREPLSAPPMDPVLAAALDELLRNRRPRAD